MHRLILDKTQRNHCTLLEILCSQDNLLHSDSGFGLFKRGSMWEIDKSFDCLWCVLFWCFRDGELGERKRVEGEIVSLSRIGNNWDYPVFLLLLLPRLLPRLSYEMGVIWIEWSLTFWLNGMDRISCSSQSDWSVPEVVKRAFKFDEGVWLRHSTWFRVMNSERSFCMDVDNV